jgi:glycosyltransferase involved in cell wall biosynthesis
MNTKNQEWPAVSLVLPCYNEEECLRQTAGALLDAFAQKGVSLQLVLVDNGSRDRTGEIIDAMIAQGHPVTKVVVPVNCGYGNGILEGLRVCTAPLVGFQCADGQVTAADTVATYEQARAAQGPVLAKVRRRFRKDSWRRKVVSILYNFGMQCVFGWLGSIDLNGNLKVLPRGIMQAMKLESKDWFLDPEIMIKAKYMRLRVLERDVEGQLRQGGRSNVRLLTCWEFAKNILRYRFGRSMREWKQTVRQAAAEASGGRAPATNSGSSAR